MLNETERLVVKNVNVISTRHKTSDTKKGG
jgi:hypothetical protein